MSKRDDQDEKLNLTSSNFDPLKALAVSGERVELLTPNAPIFDNITWFVETEAGIFPRQRATKTSNKKKNTSTSAPPETSTSSTQDSQQCKGNISQRTEYSNVLTKMDNAVGPLGFLKKCMDQKLRVKVHIRSAASIRGMCLGFIEAFDKHFNMILKDVFETWKRPRRKRAKNFGPSIVAMADEEERKMPYEHEESNLFTSSSCTRLHKYAENGFKGNQSENGCYRIPRWIVKRRLKKKDVCERHVDQLLIRGEQVVTVMLEQSCT